MIPEVEAAQVAIAVEEKSRAYEGVTVKSGVVSRIRRTVVIVQGEGTRRGKRS
jgi:hypothetical protein